MRRLLLPLLLAGLTALAQDPAEQVRAKLKLIANEQAEPGSVIDFTIQDLNAWVITELVESVPEGIHSPLIVLGEGTIQASANVDFAKLAESNGKQINSVLERFLEGSRPIKLSLRVESERGLGAVTVTAAEISGVEITGTMLNLFVEHFLLPFYPDAIVNEPFALKYNMERIAIHPDGAQVFIKPRGDQ